MAPVSPQQRVTTEITLRGSQRQITAAQQAFEEQGWILRETRVGHREHTDSVTLVVEIVLPGPRFRSGHDAVHRVQELAEARAMDILHIVAEPESRPTRHLPDWYEVEPGRPSGAERTLLDRLSIRYGLRDTGRAISDRHTSASDESASFRPPFHRSRRGNADLPDIPLEAGRSILLRIWATSFPMALCSVAAAWCWGTWWMLVPLALISAFSWLQIKLVGRLAGNLDQRLPKVTIIVNCTVFGVVPWTAAMLTSTESIATAVISLGLLLAGGTGLRLLLRYWSRRQVLTAALPAVLPVLVPAAAGSGDLVHVFYAAEFGIPAEHVEIADVWRAVAALKVLTIFIALAAAILAGLGYARHFRLILADRYLTPVFVLSATLAYAVGLLFLVPDPPGEAARAAKEEVAAGHIPSPYMGIRAKPVCVVPVTDVARIPVRDGKLRPERTYLSFGYVDDLVTLWDPRSKQDMRVPAADVSVVPARRSGLSQESGCAIRRSLR